MQGMQLINHLEQQQFHVILISIHRPFHVARIPNSNLLLVVVNQMMGNSVRKVSSTKMEEVNTWNKYNTTHPCYKKYLNNNTFSRRRIDECFVSVKLDVNLHSACKVDFILLT
jgi:voltage-dependent calcium channel alpha-2/delta-4